MNLLQASAARKPSVLKEIGQAFLNVGGEVVKIAAGIILAMVILSMGGCGTENTIVGQAAKPCVIVDNVLTCPDGSSFDLAGLQGEDGASGQDGQNGLDGINGTDGLDGVDGQSVCEVFPNLRICLFCEKHSTHRFCARI